MADDGGSWWAGLRAVDASADVNRSASTGLDRAWRYCSAGVIHVLAGADGAVHDDPPLRELDIGPAGREELAAAQAIRAAMRRTETDSLAGHLKNALCRARPHASHYCFARRGGVLVGRGGLLLLGESSHVGADTARECLRRRAITRSRHQERRQIGVVRRLSKQQRAWVQP